MRCSTTSSSRAARPGVRSTIPVAYWVCRPALARCQACSSTPRAATACRRAASSTSGRPCSVTAPIAVCQPTPNVRAVAATVSACRPTRRATHRRVRPVRLAFAAASSLCSDHVDLPQSTCRQRQIRLHHNTNTGRSPWARSRSRCSRRACGAAGRAHAGHDTLVAVVSTSSSSSPPTTPAASTTKPAKPNITVLMSGTLVASTSTGASRIRCFVATDLEAPAPIQPTPLTSVSPGSTTHRCDEPLFYALFPLRDVVPTAVGQSIAATCGQPVSGNASFAGFPTRLAP